MSGLKKLTEPTPGLFLVIRISQDDESISPCKDAFQIQLIEHESCIKNSEYMPENWYSVGFNHSGSHVLERDCWVNKWAVTLPTMEYLLDFIRDNGETVVISTCYYKEFSMIEIYDGRRE